ncbi:MAG: erythromycin esterase family protein [Xanthomonadales bacterium]|nr:erythromycin esterase family protein [Xanthomonadales bacterium]
MFTTTTKISNARMRAPFNTLFGVLAVIALASCGGGGNSAGSHDSNQPPIVPPAQIPTPDLRQQRLLSDTELRTPAIDSAAGLAPPTAEETTWLTQNHYPVRSIVYDADFSDLAFLPSQLEGKRIVQLGESSHGSAEFSAVKVRLIKYLHETLGYNVLAFESSLTACHIQDLQLEQSAPAPNTGVECAFGIWDTKDLNELARYLRSTRQTAHPLRLAGFDIQASSTLDSSDSVLTWLSPLLDRFDPELTNAARSLVVDSESDSALIWACIDANQTSCPAFENHMATTYQRIEEVSQSLHALLEATPANNPDHQELTFAWLAIDALSGRLRVLNSYSGYLSGAGEFEFRDPLMAENLTRLADLVYPNDKIIVWAHNAHISKDRLDEAGNPSMGSYLSSHWGGELASIGLFMLRGVSAGNDGSPETVGTPLAGSMEAYMYSLRLGALYLKVGQVDAPGSGDDWLFRDTRFYVWGNEESREVFAHGFDGLIIIDRSSMPHYN